MSETRNGNELGANVRQASEQAVEMCCPVVELRQYTTKPGRRDEFIALFEEQFIEGQEQYGMRIIGQFRNRHRPDQFVWMRGFASMEARHRALEGFYSGPSWKEHRTTANDMMLDSDNVLLLKLVHTSSSFCLDPTNRPALDALMTPGGGIIAMVYSFEAPIDATFIDFLKGISRLCFAMPVQRLWGISSPSRARTPFRGCQCAKTSTSSSGSPRSLTTQRMQHIKPR